MRAPVGHPAAELLLGHVSGHAARHLRVVLEAHLELCEACREEVRRLAEPGGELLRRAAPTDPPPALWGRLTARLEAPAPPVPASLPLPRAAWAELGEEPAPGVARALGAGELRWRRALLGGGRIALVDRDSASGSSLYLGEMGGGQRFPRHLHLGTEHVILLAGGYDDEVGSYQLGDFASYAPGTEHAPETLDGEACWILFQLEGGVRFRGWRGLVQRLLGR